MNQKHQIPVRKVLPNKKENNIRTKSVLTDVTNTNKTSVCEPQKLGFKRERRNAIVPVHGDGPVQLVSKPFRAFSLSDEGGEAPLTKPLSLNRQIYKKEAERDDQLSEAQHSAQKVEYLHRHRLLDEFYIGRVGDWMINHFNQLKRSSYQTIFLAIELFDQFLCKTQNFEGIDLLLFGACAIYLASKVVDIYPIYVEDIYLQICQEQFTIHEILQMEQCMCRKLNYQLIYLTVYEQFESVFSQMRGVMDFYLDERQVQEIYKAIVDSLLITVSSYKTRTLSPFVKILSCAMIHLNKAKADRRLYQSLLNAVNHVEINLSEVELAMEEIEMESINRGICCETKLKY